MNPTPRTAPRHLTAFRLDENMLARIDRHARRLGRRHRRVRFTRTDALRDLVGLGLAQAEAKKAR
jgi:hypothetical protein